jgi:UDP-N-acetylglucosamine--N-acetylmuramyl-(pentapeptide) pyrophosphoryl-undecaprenol N-acetylglucosamine transferase
MTRAPHLVIMAAGTGGHIMPGLAVAREVRSRGWTVSWLGTSHGMENRLVPPAGIEMDTIAFSGLLSKPLMLVNADAALLLSNKSLLPVADRVAFGFDGPAVKGVKAGVVTGNPVRAEIEALPEPSERFAGRSGALRLLVVGGSLGAQVLNRTAPQALALMEAGARPWVVHQTGAAQADEVRAAYAAAGLQADVRPFIDDMATQLAHCDLVLCRAGAVTVSELCAAGVASVLVPLVVSTTSHQRDNAQWLAGQGAAVHLPQAEFTPETLARRLQALDREALLAMARRARSLAQPQAAARVADELQRLLGKRA